MSKKFLLWGVIGLVVVGAVYMFYSTSLGTQLRASIPALEGPGACYRTTGCENLFKRSECKTVTEDPLGLADTADIDYWVANKSCGEDFPGDTNLTDHIPIIVSTRYIGLPADPEEAKKTKEQHQALCQAAVTRNANATATTCKNLSYSVVYPYKILQEDVFPVEGDEPDLYRVRCGEVIKCTNSPTPTPAREPVEAPSQSITPLPY